MIWLILRQGEGNMDLARGFPTHSLQQGLIANGPNPVVNIPGSQVDIVEVLHIGKRKLLYRSSGTQKSSSDKESPRRNDNQGY